MTKKCVTIIQEIQTDKHIQSNVEVIIYTDGACRGNPGPGGWGAILSGQGKYDGKSKSLYGGEHDTTNNRMELMAAIKALEALKRPCHILLYTDSKYVQQGIKDWIVNWKKRGWRGANKKPVKNKDLWQALDAARERHQVEWQWVKGHAGVVGNEIADELANRGIDELLEGAADSITSESLSENNVNSINRKD